MPRSVCCRGSHSSWCWPDSFCKTSWLACNWADRVPNPCRNRFLRTRIRMSTLCRRGLWQMPGRCRRTLLTVDRSIPKSGSRQFGPNRPVNLCHEHGRGVNTSTRCRSRMLVAGPTARCYNFVFPERCGILVDDDRYRCVQLLWCLVFYIGVQLFKVGTGCAGKQVSPESS